MWQERFPSYPAIVVPSGRMQLCSGTLITGLSFILPVSLPGASLHCHVGGFVFPSDPDNFSRLIFVTAFALLCIGLGGSLLWWLGWGFARDTILSAAKRDQCTPLNPISNCIIKTRSCSITLIFLILTPFSVALSPSRQTLSADSHSGAFRDGNLVTAKTFRCVLIAVGASYVSPSTPDATVGPSN